MQNIPAYLSDEQIKYLDEIAKRYKKSRNEVLREAVSVYISMYLSSRGSENGMDKDLGEKMDGGVNAV